MPLTVNTKETFRVTSTFDIHFQSYNRSRYNLIVFQSKSNFHIVRKLQYKSDLII